MHLLSHTDTHIHTKTRTNKHTVFSTNEFNRLKKGKETVLFNLLNFSQSRKQTMHNIMFGLQRFLREHEKRRI